MAQASGSLSVKDHRQLMENAAEPSDMVESLSILRNLSCDDKTENAMLRSRIDEQSHLIMILKQRADEANQKNKTLERIKSELEDFRDSANQQLQLETKKSKMLDDRFNDLANNHQELIKFKDQYKMENDRLKRENANLKDENQRLFSAALLEKDATIAQLGQDVERMRVKNVELDTKCREMHEQLMEERQILRDRIQKTEEIAEARANEMEQRLREAAEKLRQASAKERRDSSQQEAQSKEASAAMERLKAEKDELLTLVMQRGKIIEEKVTEIKRLESKADEAKRRLKDMEDKFEREAAAVDANMQVVRLRRELQESGDKYSELDKKFEAYKKHSNTLLQQERDLNAKLRHAVG